MIRNLVLDTGNVLIRFDRETILDDKGVKDAADRDILMKEVFLSLEWAQLDRGSLTEEEAARIICARVPERLHEAVRSILFGWFKPLRPVEGMEEYIRECKALGLNVYVLSNTSAIQKCYADQLPAADIYDGSVISADLYLVKPQPEIYLYFCSRFGVKADECLFVDDNSVNIEGCVQTGWNGIVFHGDISELRRKTRAFGIGVHE